MRSLSGKEGDVLFLGFDDVLRRECLWRQPLRGAVVKTFGYELLKRTSLFDQVTDRFPELKIDLIAFGVSAPGVLKELRFPLQRTCQKS